MPITGQTARTLAYYLAKANDFHSLGIYFLSLFERTICLGISVLSEFFLFLGPLWLLWLLAKKTLSHKKFRHWCRK